MTTPNTKNGLKSFKMFILHNLKKFRMHILPLLPVNNVCTGTLVFLICKRAVHPLLFSLAHMFYLSYNYFTNKKSGTGNTGFVTYQPG